VLREEQPLRFRDREDAGHRLARELSYYDHHASACVLGLPRGGVPVAHALASDLHLPLDIYLVRKLGVPGHEELAMGAIASGEVQVLHQPVIENLHISEEMIQAATIREREEIRHREQVMRGDIAPLQLRNKTVVLVDDGIATGSSMEAALLSLRQHRPASIVVAVPVAPRTTAARLRVKVDDLIVLVEADDFRAVSEFYLSFDQVSDAEVQQLLHSGAGGAPSQSHTPLVKI
jgi:predicted phosphoribosyltransferase